MTFSCFFEIYLEKIALNFLLLSNDCQNNMQKSTIDVAWNLLLP
jgi:hypothetical protein